MRRKLLVRGVLAAAGLLVVLVVGLVVYALATVAGRLHFEDAPSPPLAASTDPELIAEGSYLVHGPAHCAACHSATDRAHPELLTSTPLHGGLEFAMGPLGTRYSRNLTPDPATGIGALTDAQLARAIRSGVMRDGEISLLMWFGSAKLSDHDVVAVMSYLRSVAPIVNETPTGAWSTFGKLLITYAFPPLSPRPLEGPAHVAAGPEPSIERGRYLAESVMLCAGCHTPLDMATWQPVGQPYSGGTPEASHGEDSHMEFAAANLTSHPNGVTGRLSEDEFLGRIRAGRLYPSSIMPWENFQATSENDLRSVYRYIKSLPPSDADTGPAYRRVGWKPGEPTGVD